MSAPTSSNGVVILGQNKIIVTTVPGTIAGTFDVQVDTSNFAQGVPLAVQCLLQSAMLLIPVAYQTILVAARE